MKVLGSGALGWEAVPCIAGGRGSDLKKLRGHDEDSFPLPLAAEGDLGRAPCPRGHQ